MDERVGKAWQGMALFTGGLIVGALLLGSGSVSFPGIGDGARAQDVNT